MVNIGVVLAALVLFLGGLFGGGKTFIVIRVIDGDRVEIADGRHIRYIGIDSPEKGDCYATAAAKLNEQLVLASWTPMAGHWRLCGRVMN